MALPAVIEEIIRIIGHGPTMELIRAFKRRELRIPRTETPAMFAALAEVIGEPAARALVRAYGGEELYIACCHRAVLDDRNRRLIARYDALLGEGHSGRGAVSILVGEYDICYRRIEKIVNSPAPQPSATPVQPSLF